MWTEKTRQNLIRAYELIGDFPDYRTITVENNGLVKVWMAPSEAMKHEAMSIGCKLVGRMEKVEFMGKVSLEGKSEGIEVYIHGYEACRIVGYKVAYTPKTITVPEMKETRVAVTDCDIRSGRIKEGEYVKGTLDTPHPD